MDQAPLVVTAALVALTGCYRAPQWASQGAPRTESPPKPPVVSADPITCDVAAERALVRHPDLETAAAREALATARADAGSAWDPPELRVRVGAPEMVDSSRVGLRLNLPVPGRAGALESAAAARIRLAQAERQALQVEVAAAARQAHLNVRFAEARVAHEQSVLALVKDTLAWTQRRATGGLENRLALRTAELAMASAADDLQQASLELARRQMALAEWTGHTAAADDCGGDAALADVDQTAASVRRAEAEAAAAHGDAAAELRAIWFWPEFLEVAWDFEEPGTDRLLLQLGFPLPILGPGDTRASTERVGQAEIRAAAATQTHAERAADAAVRSAMTRRSALATLQFDELPELVTADVLALRRQQLTLRWRQLAAGFALESAVIERGRVFGDSAR